MADIQKISGILATLHDLTVETYVAVSESDGTGDFVTKKFDIRNVDNVREYNNKTDFPTVGRAKTLYIDKSNGKIYSWDGNQYLLLSVRIVDGVVSPDSTWSSEKINTTMAQKEHTHTEEEITDLKNYALASHSHLASQITDFNNAVDNNTNVSLNTDARHTHTNKDILDNTTASYTTAEKNKLADIENQYYNKTESDNKFVNKAGDTVTGDLVVQGDLIISGTTTTVDTEQLKINDNMVTLNSNFTSGTPTQNSGVEILRGDEPTVSMYWNETTDQWELTGGILNATVANADKLDGNDSTYFATATDLTSHTSNTNNPHNVTAAQLGAQNILEQIKTVDGAGSGLDADLLDGKDSSYYATATEVNSKVSKSGDTINGNLTVNGAINGTAVTQSSTDTTANRLLKVGDFGIGNGNLAFPTADNQDFNTLTNTSFYGIRLGVYTGTLNTPPSYGYGNLQVIKGWSFITQIFYPHLTQNATQGVYYRVYYNGAWTEWVKLYSSKNIVGTVSQSEGLPTGAIIERGGNANGEYIKFADGTQIATNSDNSITTSPATFIGTITKVDNNKLWIGRWY